MKFSETRLRFHESIVCLLGATLALSAQSQTPKPSSPIAPPPMQLPQAAINISPNEAESLLKAHPEMLVIDVRTQEEFAEGHIPGAQNVNFNAPGFLERMQAYSGKSVLLHCASGGRSGRALDVLKGLSFQKLYHLQKGFNAWQEAGKPISTR